MNNFEEFMKEFEKIRKRRIPWYNREIYFSIKNVSVLLTFKWEIGIDLCETYPYAPDGDVPLIFISCGFIQFTIESKKIYKYLYDKKYGVDLEI